MPLEAYVLGVDGETLGYIAVNAANDNAGGSSGDFVLR